MARIRDAEKFEAQRHAILRAAETCFVASGFHATGVADICAEAGGMSPGRLYHYFPSKQAIVEAIVAEDRAAASALFAPLADADDVAEALADAVAKAVEATADAAYGRLAVEILAEAGRNKAIAVVVRDAATDVRMMLAEAMRQGQARGQIGAGVEPESMAGLIGILIDGSIGRTLIDPRSTPVDLAAQIRTLIMVLLARTRSRVTRTPRASS